MANAQAHNKYEVPAAERFFSNCKILVTKFSEDFPQHSGKVASIIPFMSLVPKDLPIDAFIALCNDEIFEAILSRNEDKILMMASKISESTKLDSFSGAEMLKKFFGDILATIKNILLAEKLGELKIDGPVRDFYYMVAGGLVKISAKQILANPTKYNDEKAYKLEYLKSLTKPR